MVCLSYNKPQIIYVGNSMLICPSCCLEERQTKDEFGCGFIEIDECQTDKILVSSLNCLPVTFHKLYAICLSVCSY